MIGFVLSQACRFAEEERHVRKCAVHLFCVMLLGIVGLFRIAAAEAQEVSRIDQVKAAFVLNIARFVTWPVDFPPNQSDSMQLCLYRANPLRQAMETIAGEEIGGRIAEIRRIQSLQDGNSCNILLIAPDELPNFLNEIPPGFKQPVLTVADLTEVDLPFESRQGILISLVRNGARVGFEINLEKSRQAGLRMSSELLKLAHIVGGND